MDWLTAFLLTLFIELPCLLLLLKKYPTGRVVSAGLMMNIVTHPALWFVFPSILPAGYYLFIGELMVVLIEAAILTLFFPKEGIKKMLVISFVINSLTFLTGEMIYLFLV